MKHIDTVKPLAVRVPEFALMAGISKSKAEKMVASGEIASTKIGRCRRVLVEDIRRYLYLSRTSEGMDTSEYYVPGAGAAL